MLRAEIEAKTLAKAVTEAKAVELQAQTGAEPDRSEGETELLLAQEAQERKHAAAAAAVPLLAGAADVGGGGAVRPPC